jgi:hypothetical protein
MYAVKRIACRRLRSPVSLRPFLQRISSFSTGSGSKEPILGPPSKLSVSTLDILKLPQYKFEGRVVVLSSQEEEERISGIFDNEEILGYDTEAQPQASCSIARNATSLIQIASKDVAVIWRLGSESINNGKQQAPAGGWHRQKLPPYLSKLVNNSSITKVSQGAVHEVIGLQQEFGERSPRGFVDLHAIAQTLQCHPRSLQGLVAIFMKKRLDKEQRLSDWGTSGPLSEHQIAYAACDAHASLMALLSIREAFGVPKLGCEITINPGTLWPGPSIVSAKGEQNFGTAAMPGSTDGISNTNLTNEAHDSPAASSNISSINKVGKRSASSKTPSYATKNDGPTPLSELTNFCVDQGYQLQFGGFESCRGGFRSVFKIAMPDHSTEYHRSASVHTSIREAQNCAAIVALKAFQGGKKSASAGP